MSTSLESLTSLLLHVGYIGGAILSRLLAHPKSDTFSITALVRDAEKGDILRSKFGVNAVVGSFKELEKLGSLAENAHAIINTVRSPTQVSLANSNFNTARESQISRLQ